MTRGNLKPLLENELYDFDEFRLDVRERLLLRNGKRIPLTEKAFDVLCVLVSRSGSLVTKDELFAEVWPDTIVEENSLDKNVSILRRVLGNGEGGTTFIETVRGRGYRFLTDTTAVGREKLPPAENQIQKQPKFRFVFAGAAVLIFAAVIGLFLGSRQNATISAFPRTIAILPFKPLVAENRDDVLGIGMADALIARLSGRREISVLPLSSVRKFGNLDRNAVDAGRTLGVEAVLDSGIQKVGDKIRINARLIRTADGSVLWSEKFDENYTDILALQNIMSDRISAALSLPLAGDAGPGVANRYTENVEAWEYYLKGRALSGRLTPPDIERSIEYFRKAIDRDPNYARAYAEIARAYISLPPSSDFAPADSFRKAKEAALRALEIDDGSAEAHAALGSILFWYDWDWRGAEAECKRAIELDPNSADARYTYAHLLSNMGRHPEALVEMKRARELDPVNLRINALEGQFLLHAGQPDEALDKLRKTVDLLPDLWLGHLLISNIYIEKGMYADAVSEADLAKKYSGASNHPAALKGYALAKSGNEAEARKVIDELSEQAKERFVPPYYFALIYNGLGDTDKAIAWLERGFEQRDSKMVFLKVEPKWNNLRSEPRFIDLLKRMNLE